MLKPKRLYFTGLGRKIKFKIYRKRYCVHIPGFSTFSPVIVKMFKKFNYFCASLRQHLLPETASKIYDKNKIPDKKKKRC